MNEKCTSKHTEDESTTEYKKNILYEHRPSEAWFLSSGLLMIKKIPKVSTFRTLPQRLRVLAERRRIATNVSNSMAMLFTHRHAQNPRPALLYGHPNLWVDTACYLGVTLNKRLTWSFHIYQVRKKAAHRLGGAGFSPEQKKWFLQRDARKTII